MTPLFANVLQPLIDVFKPVLVWFHDSVGLGWGMSIVALTVVIRALLLPLTLKQFKSMQALQKLQPQIKELQAKYKDDRQRLNQEMMRFYQENKVNPLGSCLPLLFQMPVFIALFYLLQKDLRREICPDKQADLPPGKDPVACGDGGAADFLFIPDLTNKATGSVLIVLIILYVGSQLVSSLLMTVTADKNQRRLILALPLVFVFFILSFPAGLIVYWITTNLWTIVQQYIVKKTVGPIRPVPTDGEKPETDFLGRPKPAAAAAATSGGGGASGRQAAPPPPPRKKKKRSGRRR